MRRIAAFAIAASLTCAFATAAQAVGPCKSPPEGIVFTPGTSHGTSEGGIAQGELACLAIRAKAGQTMKITLKSEGDNAVAQIYAPGWKAAKDSDGLWTFTGKMLPGATDADEAKAWTGTLPANGNYLVVIGAIRGGTDFTLVTSIK